jgi:hypothetical protein
MPAIEELSAASVLDDADLGVMVDVGSPGLPAVKFTLLQVYEYIAAKIKFTLLSATGTAPVFACRAWAYLDGTGTPSLTASGNFETITDNGPGDYSLNFTTDMPDANYATVITCRQDGSRTTTWNLVSQTVGSVRFKILSASAGEDSAPAGFDAPAISVSVFR